MTPTDKMVEAAARAIFQSYADNSHIVVFPWEAQDESDRDAARKAAQAALAAFLDELEKENYAVVPMEPTEEMLGAGCDAQYDTHDSLVKTAELRDMFRAMIAQAAR